MTNNTVPLTDRELADQLERKFIAASNTVQDWDMLIDIAEAITPYMQQILGALRHQQPIVEVIMDALERSIVLQSHYAKLLNTYDGGERIVFKDAAAWLERLADLSAARSSLLND